MLGIWDLSTSELTYVNHIKYAEKGKKNKKGIEYFV